LLNIPQTMLNEEVWQFLSYILAFSLSRDHLTQPYEESSSLLLKLHLASLLVAAPGLWTIQFLIIKELVTDSEFKLYNNPISYHVQLKQSLRSVLLKFGKYLPKMSPIRLARSWPHWAAWISKFRDLSLSLSLFLSLCTSVCLSLSRYATS
jgi:hypothetical protein